MSDVILRRLMTHDVDAYRELRLKALQDHPRVYLQTYEEECNRRKEFHINMIESNIIMGAFVDAVLVGYTVMSLNDGAKSKHKAMVWGAYVLPHHRDHDLAKKMRLRLFEVAKTLGIKFCTSAIVANNEAAIQVHKQVGYVEMFREKDGVRQPDGSFDDVIYLVKHL
jgi:GNAT superfamily N-acetyltransferase